MELRTFYKKSRYLISITSASIAGSIFWSMLIAMGAKASFGLTEDQSVFFIALPIALILFLIFISHFLSHTEESLAIEKARREANGRKNLPEWVILLVLGVFSVLLIFILDKFT